MFGFNFSLDLMKNKIEYLLFLGWGFLIRLLGLSLSRKLSFIPAALFFYIIPIRKKTTLDNLAMAFPEYSKKKIFRIAFASYRNFIITLSEILYLPKMDSSEIENAVKYSNVELIKKKYCENKGVILLSAHFGNWEYVAISASIQLGIPFHVIIKPQRNPYITEWLNKARTKWLNKVVPLGVSIRNIYLELKGKNIVAMVADQRGPLDGIRVPFFGRMASVYAGPAMLALKTKAPLLYGIGVRQPDYSYLAEIYEINTENLPERNEEKVIEISQRHTAYLERFIRQHPEQWLWMHKRWKY